MKTNYLSKTKEIIDMRKEMEYFEELKNKNQFRFLNIHREDSNLWKRDILKPQKTSE